MQNEYLLARKNKKLSTKDYLQQYSRRNNVRIFGLKANSNPKNEIINIFKSKLNLNIELAATNRCNYVDPTLKRHTTVNFISNRDQKSILQNRKLLKGSDVVITEDLTKDRLALLKLIQSRFRKENVWTMDCGIWFMWNNRKYRVTNGAYLQTIEETMTLSLSSK